MQDRYAGDVGDFSKFNLLRFLVGGARRGIGIVWYLFPDENHNNDGGLVAYGNDPRFLACDPNLCERLNRVRTESRRVSSLEAAGLLPGDPVYFSERLDFHVHFPSQRRADKEERQRKRDQWLLNATRKVRDCNIVFLDPDNGIQIASCPKRNQSKSGKFAYFSEIKAFSQGRDLCIVYHHLNRLVSHSEQIISRIKELRVEVKPSGKILALRFWPYSPRAYFILTSSSCQATARKLIHDLMSSPCGKLWDYFEEGLGSLNYTLDSDQRMARPKPSVATEALR